MTLFGRELRAFSIPSAFRSPRSSVFADGVGSASTWNTEASMHQPPSKALIIGGGIAGPVAALLLHRTGMEVEIFEAHDEPSPDVDVGTADAILP
jgi:pyruvate/2-oxoglutarate dehydrogenase complex dihydrolipoamide dehydrogenase (E3) component